MSLIARIKYFFKRFFNFKKTQTVEDEPCVENPELDEQALETFKMNNIIFEKLKHLEQYIKIFSLQFPKEYSHYLKIIQDQLKDYEEELANYKKALAGDISFSIDPEKESRRFIAAANLETDITNFVEMVFNFSMYKNKFYKLCSKLTQFYNALLDTKRDCSIVSSQLDNAIQSMQKLVTSVKELRFFKMDSRKKEVILNYIIYGEYIFLKSSLRCALIHNFDDYKIKLSKFHNLFIGSEYDHLIFRYFIQDLESYQLYINNNLKHDATYNDLLESCQKLQTRLKDFETAFKDPVFLEELIRFENTVDTISEKYGVGFLFPIPKMLDVSNRLEVNTRVKDIAMSVLNMLDCNSAKILCKVISDFKADISWREFYFLCKVFELYDDIVQVSKDTIFSSVSLKFPQLEAKYSQYSDTFIQEEKEKLLHYNGSKSKKYVFLLSVEQAFLPSVCSELERLRLDFCIRENDVYLNHSYFNGFKNLEKNFGNYKLLEELL